MQLDSMLQRISRCCQPRKWCDDFIPTARKYRNPEKYVDRQKNLCGCDVMVQRTEGAGHIMATGTERLNCSRLPAAIFGLKRLRPAATLNSAGLNAENKP